MKDDIKLLRLAFDNKDRLKLDKSSAGKIRYARKRVLEHYSQHPQEFIEDFIKIVHFKTNASVPFVLNEAQQLAMNAYKEHNWIAIPKARQLGITTWTNAVALHHALFSENAFVLCMAVKADNAAENLSRIRTMFSTLPEWLKVTLIEFDKFEHSQNKNQWSFKSRATGTKSTLEVASAASEDSTRGKQVTFAHWTETAFSDVADKVFTSMSPALRRRPDSRIVLESTGNGATGLYYEICMGKKDGFKTIFLPWHSDTSYKIPGELSEDDRVEAKKLLGVDVELDDDQLLWYKDTVAQMGLSAAQQEYPNTVEQVFLSTNLSFFGNEAIQKCTLEKPKYFLSYSEGFLTKSTAGSGQVWEAPRADYEYLISCDPSEGVLDPTSIQVFNPHGHEVAHWLEKIEPGSIAQLVVALARHYGEALVVVESNNIGHLVIHDLRTRYFYRKLYQDEGKVGIRTSSGNKAFMLATLQSFILEDKLTIRNSELPEQMKTFQADTMKAMKDSFDDVVMSSAMAAWVFERQPPKLKVIRDNYRDYTDLVDQNRRKRQFIL